MTPDKNYLIGFFHVEGHGKVTIETPLSGRGSDDYQGRTISSAPAARLNNELSKGTK
jgi:hypothetical protein